jgi:fibronectin type 3 domain-containing protein
MSILRKSFGKSMFSKSQHYLSRQTSSSATIEIISASWYGTSFTDMTPPEGNVVYLVRALESVHSSLYGKGGVFVEPQEVTVGKPVVITTVLDNQTVSLMWDDTENATEYVVSRRTVSNPSWQDLTTTSGTGFVDTTPPLGTVEYTVTAKHGLSSTKSDNVEVSVSLATPVVEISQDNPNEIGLTWDTVPNAAYYSVWVKIGTASWTRLTTSNNFTSTEYTVTNPPSGTVKYGVKAHNGSYTSSMGSKSVDIPVVISAPVIEAEFQGNCSVSITWNAVTNATGYTIYRRATGTTAWSQVNTTTLTTTSFTDTNVAFGDWDYCVVASNDTVSSADSNVAPVSVTLDAPSTIQASLGTSGVTVTWGAVTQATYYSVWIKAGDAAWAKIANQVSGTSFVDTNPPAGSVKYGVKAHNGSEASARKNTQQALTVPLSPPSTMTASLQNDGTVDLTWNAVTDATSYSVWIKDSSGTWTSLANNVTGTSYTDTVPPTGTVEYAVKAHKGTLTSDLVSDSVNIPLPLSSPVIEAELQSNGTVLVTWDAIDNATGYVVNRRVAGTTAWTQVNTGTLTATEFVDTTVPLGDFEYSITAVNSSNSADSNVESVAVTICSPIVTADTSDPDKVDLTWNAVNNADYYSVWIKVGTAAWTRLANNVTGTSFTDTSPLNGTTVKYAVKAHNGSIISTMTPTNVNVPALGLPAPSGFAATASSDGSTVDLTWNAVTGATHYSVWIKDSSGTWVCLANNVTGTGFTDTAPLTGILEYAVRAHTSTTMSALVTTTVDNSGSASTNTLPPFGEPTLTAVAQSDGTVQLTWNAVADATHYRLFYKIVGVHTAYQVLVTSITDLTYLVSGLPSGATIQFGVKAFNGTVSSTMNVKSVTIA